MASDDDAVDPPATQPRAQPVEPPAIAPARVDREVLRAELAEIIRRRRRLKSEDAPAEPPADDGDVARDDPRDDHALRHLRMVRDRYRATGADDPPTVLPRECGLVGLALSGGGIRSASFCLGVLQVLAGAGKLRFADYLSTVSGGGYIGSSWSALLARSKGRTVEGAPDFPFIHIRGGDPAGARGRAHLEEERRRQGQEPVALVHVRDFANYLAPAGLWDQVRTPALLLRGLVVNLLIVLPFLLLTAAVTLALYGSELLAAARAERLVVAFPLTRVVFWVCVAYLAAATAYQAWSPRLGERWRSLDPNLWEGRRSLLFGGTVLFGLLALAAGFELQPLVISFLVRPSIDVGAALRFLSNPDLWSAVGVIGGVAAALFAGQAAGSSSALTRRMALVLVGVLGPLSFWLIYLVLCRWPIESMLAAPGAAGPTGWRPQSPAGWALLYLALAALLYLWGRFFVDINRTSLHSFYRDRLSRAFMIRVRPEHDPEAAGPLGPRWCVDHEDDVRLSELRPSRSGGPYHLVNAVVNSPDFASDRLGSERQRGRRADFFVFSPCYCGNERLGYCETPALEGVDPHLNLATAMAVSAAAAAPNRGQKTPGPFVVFLMAMLNVRLGYWLRRPTTVDDGKRFRWPVGPIYFLRELIGIPTRNYDYVNLTDGGHLDNLGLFELLRRRCRYIIAIDAEADPGMAFNGLATVQRFAQVDLGARIDIDIEDLRPGENGLSRRHFALGRIDYGDGEVGELLYIKSSLTGSEVEYLKEYKARNQAFPHEPTGDQFFDEAQFEAYRALGHKIGSELVRDRYARSRIELRALRDERDAPAATADDFFAGLREWLRPAAPFRDAFLALHAGRRAIEFRLGDGPLAGYAAELYPELVRGIGSGTDGRAKDGASSGRLEETAATFEAEAARLDDAGAGGRRVDVAGAHDGFAGEGLVLLQLVNEKMQLMERALLDLRLDEPANQHHPRNRGLMNLFRRWAEAPTFRRYWAVSIANHSDVLQVFGKHALGLDFEPRWRRATFGELSADERRLIERTLGGVPDVDRAAGPQRLQGLLQARVAARPSSADGADSGLAFPVGVAFVELRNGASTVAAFRIRDTYRDLRLDELLLTRLKDDLARQGGTPRFRTGVADTSPAATYLRDLAARLGYET